MRPSIEEFKELVRKNSKGMAMRQLYANFRTPEEDKPKYRQLYDRFWEQMPDAHNKGAAVVETQEIMEPPAEETVAAQTE